MNIINVFFVFALGAITGKILEFFWRLAHERKIISFGFCYGPYLPIYGAGTTILYVISLTSLPVWSKLILFPVTCTILELLVGLFLLQWNKRLWDYSQKKWNYKGVISAFHSFIWFLLGIMFYYSCFPLLLQIESMFQQDTLITLLGGFYIIMGIDVFFSLKAFKK